MRYSAKPVTPESIASANRRAITQRDALLEKARRCAEDLERARRRAEQLCATCYYLNTPQIAGHAITTQPCGLCKIDQVYQSTATNVLCTVPKNIQKYQNRPAA